MHTGNSFFRLPHLPMKSRELKRRDVLEEDEYETVFLLFQLPVSGHLHLQTTPVTAQIPAADQANSALTVVDAVRDVVHDILTHLLLTIMGE